MTTPTTPTVQTAAQAPAAENQIIAERREKLAALRAAGNPFPNDFDRRHFAAEST